MRGLRWMFYSEMRLLILSIADTSMMSTCWKRNYGLRRQSAAATALWMDFWQVPVVVSEREPTWGRRFALPPHTRWLLSLVNACFHNFKIGAEEYLIVL